MTGEKSYITLVVFSVGQSIEAPFNGVQLWLEGVISAGAVGWQDVR